MMILRALTVQQPLTSALFAGPGRRKTIENRGRPLAPGWLAIHAGAAPHPLGVAYVRDPSRWPECPDAADLPMRAILGVVRIAGSLPLAECTSDPWALPGDYRDPWCWLVAEAIPLAEPIPWARGQLGTWTLPADASTHLARIIPYRGHSPI